MLASSGGEKYVEVGSGPARFVPGARADRIGMVTLRGRRDRTGLAGRLPSARVLVTVAGIVVTAVLMLELGAWYFVALVALYAGLDVAERLEERRSGRTMAAILRTTGRRARSISFGGGVRHCERAAWIAREMGWLAQPMVRQRLRRHSIRFVPAQSSAPLSALLQALERDKLITRIHVPEYLPKSTSRAAGLSAIRRANRGPV